MSALRKSARGQECQARMPGICNGNPETVVLCHIRRPFNAGIGTKPNDLAAFYACSACHDEWDGRTRTLSLDDRLSSVLDALLRTHEIMLREKLVRFK